MTQFATYDPDFLPTATLSTLRWRAEVLRRIRDAFAGEGYWEVETPLLSHDGPVDPHLDAFPVAAGQHVLALQTSPEFGLKRLLVAGADAIFQLGKAFRRGERGRLHNPEFTMLEWYRAGDTYLEQMGFVERLVCSLAAVDPSAVRSPVRIAEPPFRRTTYQDAFRTHAGIDPFAMWTSDLAAFASVRGVAAPEIREADRNGWLNLLLAELVEPHLGRHVPEFLYDYPASQAALSQVRLGDPPVAERFELYIDGIEICNGYTELTDAHEFRRRIAGESARRAAEGLPPLPETNRLLSAMQTGLPPCAGVALGVDRLLMVLGGFNSLDDVVTFPIERA